MGARIRVCLGALGIVLCWHAVAEGGGGEPTVPTGVTAEVLRCDAVLVSWEASDSAEIVGHSYLSGKVLWWVINGNIVSELNVYLGLLLEARIPEGAVHHRTPRTCNQAPLINSCVHVLFVFGCFPIHSKTGRIV